MAKSPYEEKILEKMRNLNTQMDLLREILEEIRKEKENGKTDSNNG